MSAHRLESKRLLLLPWEPGDWIAFTPIATDPLVMKYISGGHKVDQTRESSSLPSVRVATAENSVSTFGSSSQRERIESSGFADCNLWTTCPELRSAGGSPATSGVKDSQRRLRKPCLNDGFGRLGLRRIVAVTLPENQASVGIMQKLGMTYETEEMHCGFRVVLYSIEEKY